MKYLLLLPACVFYLFAASQDTVYVEYNKDPRYLLYLDSVDAYETGYSVARNVADAVKNTLGSNALDDYFMGGYTSTLDSISPDYYYNFFKGVKIDIGHVNDQYVHMKDDPSFPWQYLEAQYKRLDKLRVQPWGIIQGGELPNVYVYAKPKYPVAVRKKERKFTVIGQVIKFAILGDGKTKTPYIEKVYYSQDINKRPVIDSIQKLNPVDFAPLGF
jgi:hypothetical protein